ncbi:MAG: 1,4-dihydroxy-2-naphthoate octaprenyltransferase, partial [Candidatus Marinimicrobia bacterium]|nr:1,4-dihydroxy-2-naphthoate octaprenyltransferase [Candidatus Neomarinimicrobiota bacterium]
MKNIFQENVKTLIDDSTEFYLSSNVTSISHSIKTGYVNDDFDLYVFIRPGSVTAAHLNFNPYVNALFPSKKTSEVKDISVNAYAVPINNTVQIDTIVERWNKKYSQEDHTGKELYKLMPLSIEYADKPSGEVVDRLEFPQNQPGLITRFLKNIAAKLQLWVGILRAPFFTASIAPVILGAAVAYHQQSAIHWSTLFLTLIGAIIAQAAANVINDYYDHRSGNDEVNIHHNTFSGGSRMIQNKIITPGMTYFIAVCLFLITIVIGLYLNFVTAGNVILYIGMAGLFLAFTYSATPLKLSYRGIGELAIVGSFGPLIVMGTYYVQVQSLDILPLLASIPNGILVGLILFINEFQDMQADGSVGKNTLVVKMKVKQRSLAVYKILLIFVFLWLAGFTVLNIFPVWTLLTMLALPLVFRAFAIASKNYDKINELLPVNALTIAMHLIITLLFAV